MTFRDRQAGSGLPVEICRSGDGQLLVGRGWLPVRGGWLLVGDGRLLVGRGWLPVRGGWLLVGDGRLLVGRGWLPAGDG